MVATVVPEKLDTVEDLLAMPDDGIDRWLQNGKLVEAGMTTRNRFHSRALATIKYLLLEWSRRQPEPRGTVVSGEAGFILKRNPDSVYGIDVAFISPEMIGRQSETTTLFDGAPVLAVEILRLRTQTKKSPAKSRTTFPVAFKWFG